MRGLLAGVQCYANIAVIILNILHESSISELLYEDKKH